VVPYFGYARQDRKDEGRAHYSQSVANMITRQGDRVLAMDLYGTNS
jgi:ribose-phosphate pyrophosphokinase